MIFLTQSFEKNLIFQVERLLKKFYDPAKQEKSLYSGEESRKSNTVANMVTKIDIDALKVKKNQEQMIPKIGKKLTTACLNSRVTGSIKEQCTSTCSLLKEF